MKNDPPYRVYLAPKVNRIVALEPDGWDYGVDASSLDGVVRPSREPPMAPHVLEAHRKLGLTAADGAGFERAWRVFPTARPVVRKSR